MYLNLRTCFHVWWGIPEARLCALAQCAYPKGHLPESSHLTVWLLAHAGLKLGILLASAGIIVVNTMPGFYVCVHAHVPAEARGGQQMSGSITPHWIPLRQGLSLTLKATELLGSAVSPLILGLQVHADTSSFMWLLGI